MKFRAIERCDLDIIRKNRNDELQFLRTPYFLTEQMQEEWYASVISNRGYSGRFFAIDHDEKLIGYCGINPIQWENRLGEIAIMLFNQYRGAGVGKQIFKKLMEYGFDNLNLKTLYGEYYHCANVKFWESALDKTFTKVILPNRKYWAGKYWDSTYFSKTK